MIAHVNTRNICVRPVCRKRCLVMLPAHSSSHKYNHGIQGGTRFDVAKHTFSTVSCSGSAQPLRLDHSLSNWHETLRRLLRHAHTFGSLYFRAQILCNLVPVGECGSSSCMHSRKTKQRAR